MSLPSRDDDDNAPAALLSAAAVAEVVVRAEPGTEAAAEAEADAEAEVVGAKVGLSALPYEAANRASSVKLLASSLIRARWAAGRAMAGICNEVISRLDM